MDYDQKIQQLRIEIRKTLGEGNDIDQENLIRKYEIECGDVKKIVLEETNDLKNHKNDESDTMLTQDLTIKTKETLAFLHKNSKDLIEKAIQTGNYQTALSAMNTLSKQVELTMKKLGELNPNNTTKTEIIPDDFLKFLTTNLKRENEEKK